MTTSRSGSVRRYTFEEWVSAIAFTLMVLIVCTEILVREGLKTSFLWSEAVGRYLMIWSVYFGAVAAIGRREHLRIDMLLNAAPPRVAAALEFFSDLWVLAVSMALAVAGFEFVRSSFEFGLVSQGVPLPFQLGWIYLVIPVTFGLSVIHVFIRLARAFRGVHATRSSAGSLDTK